SVFLLSSIPLELNPKSIAINPSTDISVIPNEMSDSVSIIDMSTQKVISTIPVGKAPKGVSIDKALNLAVIGNSHDNIVSLIDMNTYRVIAVIPVGKSPEGIAIDSLTHRAFVANHKDNSVSVIDLMTYSPLAVIPVGHEPIDVSIDPELNLGIVVNEKDYNVSVIDLNTYNVTGKIPVGKKPHAIDINPETHLSAIANEKDNSITIINLLNWETVTIPLGKHPIDVAINQLDNRCLVICDEDRSLLLIDLNTNTIIKNYALNKLPRGVAVNNFTNIAGVVDDKEDSLTLIQLPNPIAFINSISPATLLRGDKNVKIVIEGSRFIKTSTVSIKSDTASYTLIPVFIDNHRLEVEIPAELFLKTGTWELSIINPAPEGGTSNTLTLKVENPVPQIALIDPMEVFSGITGLTLYVFGDGFFEDTRFYINGVERAVNFIRRSKVEIELSADDLSKPGKLLITAFNAPPVGGTSNTAILTVKPSLEIKITSPLDGETINRAGIMVKGTVKSDTKDIGITVNGAIADIYGNQWVANDVPLTLGSNIINAVVVDSYGNKAQDSITIYTESIAQPIKLNANLTSGISPLTVYFSVSTELPNPIASYKMDFEGDGIIDWTGASFESISHTYTLEGIFYPTLYVTDTQGNIYSDVIAITVLSKTEMDN
ncbi:MAG: hypothetical protein HY752_04580, partial [Nitrospirae bacterium]|nr:hypothetical protein [Nitrospirota bacterium]